MIKLITIITKFIIATILALLASSCNSSNIFGDGIKGSGNITTETRTANQDFKNIDVSNGIKVIVEQADTKFITVEVDDNLQNHIITKIENGVLKIEADKNYNSTETPTVTVKMPILNELSTSSGSLLVSSKVIISDFLNAKSSSGSQMNIEVEADAITLESSSGSSIEARGKTLKLETSSSSGSTINAKKLLSNEVSSQSSSGSSTSVYPIIKLEAKANSGSSITYHKKPNSISKEENSGGNVSEN
ncbi:MAG TPA: head GIN domain-containing protein [Flavobacterium sp.]|jgi:hypothetical protein|nr:head GIN domain-containing protein [Flavobacterium sp.]